MKKKAFIKIRLLITTGLISVGIFAGLLFFLPSPNYKKGFENVHELQEFSKTLDEWIKMESDDFFKPRYDKYYQNKFGFSLVTSFTRKLKDLFFRIGLVKNPDFSEIFFKNILTRVTNSRVARTWTGDFVQKIELNSVSKLVVFGVIQGAFHGMVRDLGQLFKLKIIDENFKLISPDYYIILLGNVVNRSPYTLEILTIVLRLLEANPENVIYLKGTNEFQEYWQGHTLKKELQIRSSLMKVSEAQIINQINAFFNTLPLALYGSITTRGEDTHSYLKIIPYQDAPRLKKMMDENEYKGFIFEKNHNRIESLDVANVENLSNKIKQGTDKIQLKSVIMDILKRTQHEEMDGLRLLDIENGVTYWNVLSTAAEPYRLGAKFFNDTFLLIDTSEKLEDWLITLYKRDVRDLNNMIYSKRSVYLFSGKEIK